MTISLYDNPDKLFYTTKEELEKTNLVKWAIGSKPASTKGNVMSWSTSKTVASLFMGDDDIKNTMHVMCRYDNPTYDQIVCDTRVFHDSEYWGEQEITLTQDALDYVVDEVFVSDSAVLSNKKEYEKFKKASRTHHTDLSAYSFSRFMEQPFDYRDYNIKADDKLKIKVALNNELRMKGTGGISNIGTGVTPGIYQCLEIIRGKSGNVQDGWKVSADTVTFKVIFIEPDSSMYSGGLVSCTLKQKLATINKFVFDLTIHLKPTNMMRHLKLLENEVTRNRFKKQIITWFEYYKHVTVNVLFDGI